MSSKRIHLICTVANRNATEALLTEMHGKDETGSQCIPLSPTGQEPPTHFGSSGIYTSPQVAEIQTWTQGSPTLWRECAGIDNELPHFDEYIVELGLQVAFPPMPEG